MVCVNDIDDCGDGGGLWWWWRVGVVLMIGLRRAQLCEVEESILLMDLLKIEKDCIDSYVSNILYVSLPLPSSLD